MKFKAKYLLAVIPVMIGASLPIAIKASQANQFYKASYPMLAQKMGEHHFSKMIEVLDLTEDQVKQVEELQNNRPESLENAWTQLKSEMETMRNLVKESASTEALRTQHEKIQSLHTEMGSQGFEQMLKLYEILTPEQRQTLAEKMGKHHRFGRRGKHHSPESEPQKQSMILTF